MYTISKEKVKLVKSLRYKAASSATVGVQQSQPPSKVCFGIRPRSPWFPR